MQHGLELLLEAIGAFAFGFVEDENVGDFHQAGLHVLHVVAEAGNETHERAIGEAHDVDLILADANRFDEMICFAAASRTSATSAVARARPPRNPRVAIERMKIPSSLRVALHANAIAENCAAGVWTGGIDGDDADRFACCAIMCSEAIDERALAGAGRAGDADRYRRGPCGK